MLYYRAMNQYLEVEFSVKHKLCDTIPHNHHIVSCCQGILAFRRCRTPLFPGMETMGTVEHLCECRKGVRFHLVIHLVKCCHILSCPNSISSKLSPLAAYNSICSTVGNTLLLWQIWNVYLICGSTTSPSSLKIISLYVVAS